MQETSTKKNVEQGDADAKLTLEFTHRIKNTSGLILLHSMELTPLFSAGWGENDAVVRSWSCKNLESLGIKLDEEADTEI